MGAPDLVAIVATVGGVVLMLVSLSDAAVTVLHADVEGPAARAAQGAAWRALRTHGRRAQAAAGPIMLVATFFVWVSLLVLGYALALWPYLTTSSRAAPGARFALLALDETHGTSDGVQLVIDRLDAESVDRFDDELQRWATMVRETDEGLHRHPRVGLLFRSLDPARDPEPAMAVALELAAAAQVVSDDPSYRYLRPRARSLADAGDRLIRVVSAQHLPRAARAALDRDPDEASPAAATRLVRRRSSRRGS